MSESAVANPNFDTARQGSIQGLIDQALANFKRDLENCLPATVISYDREKNIASVQPSIVMVAMDGTKVKRAPLASVPVFTGGGGGWIISFPLVPGSTGWLKTSDRDLSLYLQNNGGDNVAPNTKRLHSFADGVFYPSVLAGFTISGEDANSAVLQNLAGTVRIAFSETGVTITSPIVKHTTPLFEIDSALIKFTTSPIIGPL